MESSIQLRNIVFRYYAAIARGDSAFMEHLFSQEDGVIVIGTDPNEWWEGYKNIVHLYKTQLEEVGKLTIVPGDPQAYLEGNIGWVTDRPKFKLPNGKEIPARLSMVFHCDNSEWKIIQQHVSIGILNEKAIGKELTVESNCVHDLMEHSV